MGSHMAEIYGCGPMVDTCRWVPPWLTLVDGVPHGGPPFFHSIYLLHVHGTCIFSGVYYRKKNYNTQKSERITELSCYSFHSLHGGLVCAAKCPQFSESCQHPGLRQLSREHETLSLVVGDLASLVDAGSCWQGRWVPATRTGSSCTRRSCSGSQQLLMTRSRAVSVLFLLRLSTGGGGRDSERVMSRQRQTSRFMAVGGTASE